MARSLSRGSNFDQRAKQKHVLNIMAKDQMEKIKVQKLNKDKNGYLELE